MKAMNFKSQIATTREQSERLLELGLKPETADMSIVVKDNTDHPLSTRPYHDWNTYWKNHSYVIPSWSLSRLLEMLPTSVEEYCRSAILQITPPVIAYWYFNKEESLVMFSKTGFLENVVDCIEYLVTNRYFNTEYLKGDNK